MQVTRPFLHHLLLPETQKHHLTSTRGSIPCILKLEWSTNKHSLNPFQTLMHPQHENYRNWKTFFFYLLLSAFHKKEKKQLTQGRPSSGKYEIPIFDQWGTRLGWLWFEKRDIGDEGGGEVETKLQGWDEECRYKWNGYFCLFKNLGFKHNRRIRTIFLLLLEMT